jgi:uncharacterized protein (TIGR02001 family)
MGRTAHSTGGMASISNSLSHSVSATVALVRSLPPWLLCLFAAGAGHAEGLGSTLSVGGNLAVTSDYIYRGVSQSDGHGALQAELHATSGGGNFIGAWASTRDNSFDPYANADVELYLGHHFDLGGVWGAALSGRAHYFVGGNQQVSDDYQEIIASLTYMDRWALSLTAIPNAVRYWYTQRLSRSPAWVAETSGQWLIGEWFFVTGGAGYYRATGTGPGIEAANGFAYGNAGLAFEYRRWRLDVSYFLTQEKAQQLFPYPTADHRVAGTLLWRF